MNLDQVFKICSYPSPVFKIWAISGIFHALFIDLRDKKKHKNIYNVDRKDEFYKVKISKDSDPGLLSQVGSGSVF